MVEYYKAITLKHAFNLPNLKHKIKIIDNQKRTRTTTKDRKRELQGAARVSRMRMGVSEWQRLKVTPDRDRHIPGEDG